MRSDAFGCVRMRSDAFRRIRTHSDAFGHFWRFGNILKQICVDISFGVFGVLCIIMCYLINSIRFRVVLFSLSLSLYIYI